LYELGLTSIAMWRYDQPTSNLVRDLGSEVLPNNVETKIDACRAASRSQNAALIDVK